MVIFLSTLLKLQSIVPAIKLLCTAHLPFRELSELGGEMHSLDASPLRAAAAAEEEGVAVRAFAGVERLSPEQVSLCQYRHMLLCYLDRLDTYQVGLGLCGLGRAR